MYTPKPGSLGNFADRLFKQNAEEKLWIDAILLGGQLSLSSDDTIRREPRQSPFM